MRIFKIWRQNRPGWTKESRSIAFGLGCDEPDKESRGSWGCREPHLPQLAQCPSRRRRELVVVNITAEEPRPRSATVDGQPGRGGWVALLMGGIV